MGTLSPPATDTRHSLGRPYLWLGPILVVLGPILYTLQIRAKVLSVPWYASTLATVGVALVLLALLRKRTVWRFALFALCSLLAAGEWYFLLSLSKLPAYTGAVVAGSSIPPFRTTLASGSVFDQDSLRGEQHTALVFFRG